MHTYGTIVKVQVLEWIEGEGRGEQQQYMTKLNLLANGHTHVFFIN